MGLVVFVFVVVVNLSFHLQKRDTQIDIFKGYWNLRNHSRPCDIMCQKLFLNSKDLRGRLQCLSLEIKHFSYKAVVHHYVTPFFSIYLFGSLPIYFCFYEWCASACGDAKGNLVHLVIHNHLHFGYFSYQNGLLCCLNIDYTCNWYTLQWYKYLKLWRGVDNII